MNPPIKETLPSKVSFFYLQDSTSAKFKYSNILESFNNKNFEVVLKKSLDFIEEYSKPSNSSKYEYYLYEVNLIIGDIYRIINNHSKSIQYYKNAIQQNETGKDNFEFKKYQNRSERESVYLKIANEYLRNNQKDSAKKYYNSVIKSNSLDLKILSTQAKAYSSLSGIYRQDSKYDIAKEYALKALKIQEKNNNKISISAALGNLASIYLDLNKFNEAKKIISKHYH